MSDDPAVDFDGDQGGAVRRHRRRRVLADEQHAAIPVRGATSDYIVNFADVEGLVAGNPVKISGVRVGRVADIDLVPQEGRGPPAPA